MGKIMLNNIAYAGASGGLAGKELTMAEYEALSEEDKNTGLYFITDAEGVDAAELELESVEIIENGFYTYLYKKGNVVTIDCQQYPVSSLTKAWVDVCEIPENFRPAVTSFGAYMVGFDNSSSTYAAFRIKDNILQCYGKGANSQALLLTTYIC